MPAPRWLTHCWNSAHFCGRCVCTLLLWTLWLGLTVLAGFQTYLATVQRLEVPDFALRAIEDRLRASGLAATFGEAVLDPGGTLRLHDVSLSPANLPEPVLHADRVVLELDPVALALRDLEIRSVEIGGADFLLPAMISPSGRSEPLLHRANARVRPGNTARTLAVDYFTGHLGPLAIAATGAVHLPADAGARTLPLDQLLDAFSKNFGQLARTASDLLVKLPPVERPALQLRLSPDPARLVRIDAIFTADRLEVASAALPGGTIVLRDLRAKAQGGWIEGAHLTMIETSIGSVQLPDGSTVEQLNLRTEAMVALADRRFEPRLIDATLRRASTAGLNFGATTLQLAVATWPRMQVRGRTSLEGQPLEWNATGDVSTRAAELGFTGALAPSLLPWLSPHVGFDVPEILSWEQPPRLRGSVTLANGGRPVAARVDFHTGPVIARGVALDATSATVSWDGREVAARDISLTIGASEAHGTFSTIPATRDFQFLLHGRLEPPAIAGWFRDWWPRFWSSFEFRGAPPNASVEVAGRWQEPLATQLFVQADSRDAGLRGMKFDQLRTRLFLRPGFVDVLEFHVQDETRDVAGSFSRSWLLPGGDRWTRIEIDAAGRSDGEPAPALLGELGEAIMEPFAFTQLIDLHLSGYAERPTGAGTAESHFQVNGQSNGPWTFENFPFDGVNFSARVEPDRILIDSFDAGAAGGAISGRIELKGPRESRLAAFDLNLNDAVLGRAIREVEVWSAQRRGKAPPPISELQNRIANGRLNLSLTAEGPIVDFYAFEGEGSVLIDEAELGEISLLGVLSPLLRRTLLNFTTLQLDAANAEFDWRGRELAFSHVKLTGPRAGIEGHGTYQLDDYTLAFQAKVRPFEGGGGLLNAVTSPLTNFFEVKLTGELRQPNWVFVYGPTNLLRALTGGANAAPGNSPVSAPPPAPPAKPATNPGSADAETPAADP